MMSLTEMCTNEKPKSTYDTSPHCADSCVTGSDTPVLEDLQYNASHQSIVNSLGLTSSPVLSSHGDHQLRINVTFLDAGPR